MIHSVDPYYGMNTFKVFSNINEVRGLIRKEKRPFIYALELDNGSFVKVGYSSSITRRLTEHISTRGQFRGRVGRVGLLEMSDAKTAQEIEKWVHQTLNGSIIKVGYSDTSPFETYSFKPLGYPSNNFDALVDFIFVDLIKYLAEQ